MKELPNEQQLFYSQNGESWIPSVYGKLWPEEKCEGYLHKHLTWDEFQDIVNPPKSNEEISLEQAEIEHSWVASEFDIVQVELMYHWTGDLSRAVATEQEWKDYAIALRDYTTTDENGNLVVNGNIRPISPRQ